ncbi:hypothetical protein B0H13DRAFT_1132333 [Mycena leptocephala]|nr:hypothetical protein B0H13DRAFT_1132333 [Mycena leptocephala]
MFRSPPRAPLASPFDVPQVDSDAGAKTRRCAGSPSLDHNVSFPTKGTSSIPFRRPPSRFGRWGKNTSMRWVAITGSQCFVPHQGHLQHPLSTSPKSIRTLGQKHADALGRHHRITMFRSPRRAPLAPPLDVPRLLCTSSLVVASVHKFAHSHLSVRAHSQPIPCTSLPTAVSMHRLSCSRSHAQAHPQLLPCTNSLTAVSMHQLPCSRINAPACFQPLVCASSLTADPMHQLACSRFHA